MYYIQFHLGDSLFRSNYPPTTKSLCSCFIIGVKNAGLAWRDSHIGLGQLNYDIIIYMPKYGRNGRARGSDFDLNVLSV